MYLTVFNLEYLRNFYEFINKILANTKNVNNCEKIQH